VGEKEGVIIDVKGERQTVGEENRGDKIQMRQERFGRVKPRRIPARGIIEKIEERLFFRATGKKGVRGGIVLPERAEIADLPAADGLWRALETGIRSKLLSDGPAADTGPVGLEAEAAQPLAGHRAVGGARRRSQQTRGQSRSLRRPGRMMISARKPRRPRICAARSPCAEEGSAKLINARTAQAKLRGHRIHIQIPSAKPPKQMTEQRSCETTGEWWFSFPQP
jgi:hypothetical protein